MVNDPEFNEERTVPQNELDFQQMITDPVWGKSNITPELTRTLGKKGIIRKYKKGDLRTNPITGQLEKIQIDCEIEEPINLWGQLGYFTRDLRLANLDKKELDYIRENIDLAHSFLEAGMEQPFIYCISEVANINETSQSKMGFLRKQQNTLTTEQKQEIYNQPEKKDFFGRK